MCDSPPIASPTSHRLHLHTIRSRINELRDAHLNFHDVCELSPSEAESLLKDCASQLQSNINQIISDFSDFSSISADDLDELIEHLKREVSSVDQKNAAISDEIQDLCVKCIENSNQLASAVETMNCSLEPIEAQVFEEEKEKLAEAGHSPNPILELKDQITRNKSTLKSLQDLDILVKRFEAIEKVEDALTAVRVIELEGNCIRLSLRTNIQHLDNLFFQQNFEAMVEPQEQNHELLVEVVDETMELKNVDIFPNDVYIGEIVDAAKSFRQQFSPVPLLETRSCFEWLVRRIQDRIVLCTLRRFLVKHANTSGLSFEYVDKDEIIIAHTKIGVDAFIMVCEGWPVSGSMLKLKSLKHSSNHSNEFSFSFLGKVEEMANSLNAQVRQNISSFAGAIEEIFAQLISVESSSGKDTSQ